MDIRLFNASGQFVDKHNSSELMESSSLEKISASRLEVIGNKVVKFLMTSYGSDAFEPTYGSKAMFNSQISSQYVPILKLEFMNDLQRCAEFIKKSENSSNTEVLSTLSLVDLVYDPDTSPTAIHVYIKITTSENNSAVLQVKNS